jgi:4-hydroxy-2-oxoheptanedioate aldolase
MMCLCLGKLLSSRSDDLNADARNSGVLSLDQIPMAIQSGMRAVIVQFDVWGFTRLVADSLQQGWKCSKEFEGNPKPGMSEGNAKSE